MRLKARASGMNARRYFLAALTCVAAPAARAVIIYGGSGTENMSAPTAGQGGDPGWANIGSINGGASAIYLGDYSGNYWVLTASHVGAGNLVLSGGTYNLVPGSAVTVRNGDNSTTDLTMFRVATNPMLPTLSLASSTPATNSIVRMMGNGSHESGSLTHWSINTATNPDTWTQVGAPADAQGYFAGAGGKRWGDAVVAGTSTYDIGTGATTSVVTRFVATTGSSQAFSGDSGGGLFALNGSTWELLGVMGAIGTFNNGTNPDGQPGGTAVVNNVTFAGSVPAYRPAILAVTAIPEPADVALWVAAAAGAAVVWRRKRGR